MNATLVAERNGTTDGKPEERDSTEDPEERGTVYKVAFEGEQVDRYLKEEVEAPSHVRKMIEVSLSGWYSDCTQLISGVSYLKRNMYPSVLVSVCKDLLPKSVSWSKLNLLVNAIKRSPFMLHIS